MSGLPEEPVVPAVRRARLDRLARSTSKDPPGDIAERIRDALDIDLSSTFAGSRVKHPLGKASGQLSCTLPQIEADVAAGLGFIVLKTVIAEDGTGARSMGAWAEPETRMRVEPRRTNDCREGWTVTWKGRGWHRTLDEYGTFVRDSIMVGKAAGIPIIPSVKYHLPAAGESYRTEEYQYTTELLRKAWRDGGEVGPLTLEKDFSPTLAGDHRAADRDVVLEWLVSVPRLIANAAPEANLGVKVMNALYDDDFQCAMLEVLSMRSMSRPHFLTVFNRLFDPARGVAFGGWELSDRNLRILDRAGRSGLSLPPLSGTGNICSGRVMLEYALRGCSTGQVHTFFQIPRRHYTATGANRTACALHTLLLHPRDGLVPWLWHLEEHGTIATVDGQLRFRDAIGAVA